MLMVWFSLLQVSQTHPATRSSLRWMPERVGAQFDCLKMPYDLRPDDLKIELGDFTNSLQEVARMMLSGAREWAERSPEILNKLDFLMGVAVNSSEPPGLGWIDLCVLGSIFFVFGFLVAALLCVSCRGDGKSRKAEGDDERGLGPQQSPVPSYIPIYIPVVRGRGRDPEDGRPQQGPTLDMRELYPELSVRCRYR